MSLISKLSPGDPAYRLLSLAMLLAGLSTFALLYATQPLLPIFVQQFGVNAGEASLAVSLATGPMAVALLGASSVSDRVGRRPLMIMSLFAASLLTLASSILPGWPLLLVMRLFLGLSLAGVPAVAMAFIAEEVEDISVSRAMGLYIAGSAIGGMSGRLLVSLLSDYFGWRVAMGTIGVIGLVMAIVFARIIPHSRHFAPRAQSLAVYGAGLRRLFADKAMPWLYLEAFLIMGAFVTVYNYASFRLLGAPFNLSQAIVGTIFLLYILGSVSSAVAGPISSKFGPRKSLWLPLILFLAGIIATGSNSLIIVIIGIAVVTAGFFASHSIASAWVGRRARADRAQAAALYLFFYYMGASLLGSGGGFAWEHAGWNGVVIFASALVFAALLIGVRLYAVKPLPPERPVPAAPEIPVP